MEKITIENIRDLTKLFPVYRWKNDTDSSMEYYDVTSAMHEEIMEQDFQFFNVSGKPVKDGLELVVDINDETFIDIGDSKGLFLSDVIEPDFTDWYLEEQTDPDLFLAEYKELLNKITAEAEAVGAFLPKFAKSWGFRKQK